MTAFPEKRVAVVGGGPSGMTAALLLARAGHRVVIFEHEKELGGLWAANLDSDGYFLGENSCKVYQSTYRSAPALFRMLGTEWAAHFTERHDLGSHWLTPFIAESSLLDLAKLGGAFFQHMVGIRAYRDVSVAEFLASNHLSDGCQAWMRATALGGVTGTLNMTMWELFHRLGSNLNSVFLRENGVLHWNARPPNSPEGFVSAWRRALDGAGVEARTGTAVVGLSGAIDIETADHEKENFDAVFLAIPPRAMARILAGSPKIAGSFGHPLHVVQTVLQESVYEHYGLSWTFDRDFPRDLPLGGNNVRRGWHPILVQYSQYRQYLRPPAVTCVIASISLDTDFLHPRLGTRATRGCSRGLLSIAKYFILGSDAVPSSERSPSTMLKHPSAFLPVAMSLGALATVLVFVALHGTAPQADEGAAAHIWQLLMGAQVPIVLFFAIKWLPQSPRQALPILGLQVGAALAAMSPVFLLHW